VTPKDLSAPSIQQLLSQSLLQVFNERDAPKRASAIAATYDPNVTFHDPDGAVTGHEAIGAKVGALLDRAPGWVFQAAGEASVNADLGRLSWTFGPPDAPVVRGTDIALVDGGRIRALYTFIEGRPRDA
jgi:hypothetical protein